MKPESIHAAVQINVEVMWLDNEAELMGILAGILSGPKEMQDPINLTPAKRDGGIWQLDCGNDFWAQFVEGRLVLVSRYKSDLFDALVDFCRVWLEPKKT